MKFELGQSVSTGVTAYVGFYDPSFFVLFCFYWLDFFLFFFFFLLLISFTFLIQEFQLV